MNRRDLLIAGLSVGALGAAEAIRPRKRLVLLRDTTVEATIPQRFGSWESETVDNLVNPQLAGRLAKTLYSETVARVYYETTTGSAVMLLAAYGDTQSDLLQLHRPESCYPAVGFSLALAESVMLPLPGGAVLPARHVIATTQERSENIVYWTRMGNLLPQTGGEQRMARLENAVKGYVPDGILVRCSTVGESGPGFKLADRFVGEMLRAVAPAKRPPLVGDTLSRQIAV